MANLDEEKQLMSDVKKELDEVRENYYLHLSTQQDVLEKLDDRLCEICYGMIDRTSCTEEDDLRLINTYVEVSHELREVYKARRKLYSTIQDECRGHIEDIWNDMDI